MWPKESGTQLRQPLKLQGREEVRGLNPESQTQAPHKPKPAIQVAFLFPRQQDVLPGDRPSRTSRS